VKALICGVNGQDGAYLAAQLLDAGYTVVGSSRDATTARFDKLERLGIAGRVQRVSMALNDFRSVLHTLRQTCPDEIYNLAGQSSVGLSFEQPVETMDSIAGGTLNLLEAIRFENPAIRFYNAGSGECFGDCGDAPATEATPFRPTSPYAVAKASAFWLVRNYREAYGLHACTGILFNHESPLRPERFVTRKIVQAAARIARGEARSLELGNIGIARDWGWAADYVRAMHLMLQQPTADDYIVATGRTVTLEYFIERAFGHFGLDWRAHVKVSESLLRPADFAVARADPRKARERLGWQPSGDVEQVIERLCAAEVDGR